MKKLLLLTIVLLGGTAIGTADAGFVESTGQNAILSVADISKMADDKDVIIKGTIEKRLGRDKYQFVDATGKIVVEIDKEDWRGLDVTPNDTVIIYGETDKSMWHDTQVEADFIRKAD